jgi:hypothetical protein
MSLTVLTNSLSIAINLKIYIKRIYRDMNTAYNIRSQDGIFVNSYVC